MNAQHGEHHDAPQSEFDWTRFGFGALPWLLRLKVGWVESEIHELERLLDDEFGIAETAPIHAEHIALLRERDALMRRLTEGTVSAAHD